LICFSSYALACGSDDARPQAKRNLSRCIELGGRRLRAGGSGAIKRRIPVGGIIYLVGLVVVILAILSFLGLR
jgi:hypothetical protein